MVRSRLRILLAERGLSQRKLQSATGLSYTTISRLVNDRMERFDRATLNTICEALNCYVQDIIEYRPTPDPEA